MSIDQLIDGKLYNLGATTGKWSAQYRCFLMGNCFVDFRPKNNYREVV